MPEVDDAQRQERRKKAGDLLKMADKLFKGSDFEGAARLVAMAMETDPQNAYALAYQERVRYAIAQRDGQRLEAPRTALGAAPEGVATPDQTKQPVLQRSTPEEIRKKLEEAQRKIADERSRSEKQVPGKEPISAPPAEKHAEPPPPAAVDTPEPAAPEPAPGPVGDALTAEIAELKAGLDLAGKSREEFQRQIQDVQQQLFQSRETLESERRQWNGERDTLRAQWEQRLEEERARLAQQRTESEQRLESAAKTLRVQLEEGQIARGGLQKQIQDLQAQIDKIHSTSLEERQKWGAERESVLDATRAEWESRIEEERRRLEAADSVMHAQVQELEAARNTLQAEAQELRQQVESLQESARQERAQWEEQRAQEVETTRAEWEERLAEEHRRLDQVHANAELRLESVTSALRRQMDEAVAQREAQTRQLQELKDQLKQYRDRLDAERKQALEQREHDRAQTDEERRQWDAALESERAATMAVWEQRLLEDHQAQESREADLMSQFQSLVDAKQELEDRFRELQQQHEELVTRFAEDQVRWDTEREQTRETSRLETERRLTEERKRLEDVHARRVEADLDAWETRLQEEHERWETERKDAERALQARYMAEISAIKAQLQGDSQSRKQEESQALQDLRRALEQEAVQRLENVQRRHQEERHTMEQEMQSRLAAEAHRQEDLRREQDELRTQLDGARTMSETERRRLEEEFQHRILTERAEAVEEIRQRLEERFEQERESLVRSTRAAVDAELQGRFTEERAGLVREQQRLEDELRRANDKQQLEAQEGKAARSQVEEFQKTLIEEQRVHERRSQEALEAAEHRWKLDLERQVEESRTTLIAEYERRLEAERQQSVEQRNKDQYEALEARRKVEDQLRHEFEETLLQRLKEERERALREYEERLEGERTRLEADLQSAFDAEAQRRNDEEGRIAREERLAREEEERERRKQEEARKYEDAVRQAIEEGRRKAHTRKIASHLEQGRVFLTKSQFAQAREEVTRIFSIDATNADAQSLEQAIAGAQVEHERLQDKQRQMQEEQKRRLEEIQKQMKEQELKEREQEKERAVRDSTASQRLSRAVEYRRLGALDKALGEVQGVLSLDPGHAEAQDMEISILTQQKGHKEVREVVARRTKQGDSWRREQAEREEEQSANRDRLKEESGQVFRSMLKRAWMQGVPGRDTRAMLDVARVSLGISETDQTAMQSQVQLETYREALEMALEGGLLTITDTDALDGVRNKFGIDMPTHAAVIASLRRRS